MSGALSADSHSTLRFRDVECPVCAIPAGDTAFWAIDRLHGIGDRFRYARCDGCGLLFQSPQVVPECIGQLYPGTYAPHAAAVEPSRDSSTQHRAFADRVRSWIENVRLDSAIERSLTAQSRVLDVGCGSGEFLARVRRDSGAQVFGVDLSREAAQTAKLRHGIEVACGTVETIALAPRSLDLVTAWWSFEHVTDPKATLEAIHRLLRSGGSFVFGIPNSRSVNARVFRDRWYHLDCPRHLYLWTPSSIRKMLERHGFEVEHIRYDKTPWGLLGSLQYAIYGDNRDPDTADKLRRNPLLARWLLLPTVPLGLLGLSDTMIITATKR